MAKDDAPGDGSPRSPSTDVALIHGVAANGDLAIIRRREDRIELGAVRPLKEGVPIVGEVVRLTPRPEFPLLCDVKTEFTPAVSSPPAGDTKAASDAARKGPAQVATAEYRANWERIWSNGSNKDERSN